MALRRRASRPASTTWPRRSPSGGAGRPTWRPTAGSGLTWPEEYGGRGLGALENYVVIEELARARAPELVGRIGINLVGPHAAGPRDTRAEGALPAPDPLGGRAVVPALQRAGRRERPGVAHDPRRAGRGRVPGERAQGLDLLRPVRRLGPLPHPERPRRAEAPAGHHRAHRRHARRGRGASTRSCSRPGRPSSTRSSWTTSSCRPSGGSAPRARGGASPAPRWPTSAASTRASW